MELCEVDKENCIICVRFDKNSGVNEYPFLWLRENCTCAQCFHPVSLSRLFLLKNLDLNIQPSNVQIDEQECLCVDWTDGHSSSFNKEWLRQNSFTNDAIENEEEQLFLSKTLWSTTEMNETTIHRISFKNFLESDRELHSWLSNFETHGLCLVEAAPKETGVIAQLCEKISFVKRTHYGTTFLVEGKSDPSNIAYTPSALGFHVDLPYYTYIPEIQLLHCIHQASKGGESIFVDAFRVVSHLKEQNQTFYDILSQTQCYFADRTVEEGKEYFLSNRRPIIELDAKNNVLRVNHSFQRVPLMKTDARQASLFYRALFHFEQICLRPEYCLKFLLGEGCVVFFDNKRVLHGRESFILAPGERRLLEGAYLDWDGVRSKRRVLYESLHGRSLLQQRTKSVQGHKG